MINKENTIEVLNDLIKINNDRIAGYEKASEKTDLIDGDLQILFNRMINESKGYVQELSSQITSLGGDVDKGTTFPGKIYRAWMDVKNTFAGQDRKSILESCEYGEDAAQKAYNEAIESEYLDTDLRSIIIKQKSELLQSHNVIRGYRDAARIL
ncbi:PA2169 family four-helix-bundle protein [Danxiaibacter flavus]|uniref:PA2169 family four-helix-bundle protein n=1 Tax=Danxiaibacter flavus TaxID=3049108 RepID=A0ABV3ZHJ1_9BACT|nr:PA2169 family four-helix-bundle protein [Chitinophagaceae bacterium DXS]